MQKSFIAIALALTLTSAFAAYTTQNYVTNPTPVAQNSETNFTNQTNPQGSPLSLASITSGNLYLVSGNLTINSANASASNWNLFYRQLNIKSLASTQNNTASISAPTTVVYINNYAISFVPDTTSGASNLYAYQIPLVSGTTGPARLQLSNNTNNSSTVTYISSVNIGNIVYVAYSTSYPTSNTTTNFTANINSFTVGATAPGTNINVSTVLDPNTFSLTWGEALGSSQLFAVWSENGVLKDALIDVSKRTVATPTVVPNYNKSGQTCNAFATDKKLYGEFCFGSDPNNESNIIYWVRTTANGTLIQVANYPSSTSSGAIIYPYGPYLAVFFQNTTSTTGVNYAYEIWNLDIFNATSVQPRKQFLYIDSASTQIPFRVVSGGIYTLLYDNRLQPNATFTNVQVGLVLGSSYLASVLGFLLTIVAGLFLF